MMRLIRFTGIVYQSNSDGPWFCFVSPIISGNGEFQLNLIRKIFR